MSTVPAEQYRIEQVQILNWGGYAGLQVMRAGRVSTAILGPSGRGKSTLLDAMASVIMPNPQEFNQAARDE
ncbi:MAG: ATP-binding protein [Streptosporangiaceae bacterium]